MSDQIGLPPEVGLDDEHFVPDRSATSIYRKIFGSDVVACAYVNKPEQISPAICRKTQPDEDGSVPTGGDVVLELRNGKLVRLWASEWGGAWSYDPRKPTP